MSLESIVTSLEFSQKLEEIGIKQEGLFYWLADYIDFPPLCVASGFPDKDWGDTKFICAFTAQELWDMIHKATISISIKINKMTTNAPNHLLTVYDACWEPIKEYFYVDTSIANCLAQLIIAQHEGEKNE